MVSSGPAMVRAIMLRSTWMAWTMVTALGALGCGGGEPRPIPGRPAPAEDFANDTDGRPPPTDGHDGAPKPAGKSDGPHISRSVGEEGGVVVFWPRVIPKTEDAAITSLARDLQKELAGTVKATFTGKAVDVRPEPERVCPRDGCAAMTVGLLLTHIKGGCAVMALVSGPGKAPQKVVPWAGLVQLKRDEVPFREPPESDVTIKDAVPCADVMKALEEKKADVVAAMKKAAP